MDWIRSIVVAVAVAMVFRWAVGEPFRIPSESMMPTLQIGDRIWVNKWCYGIRFPFDGFRIPFTQTNLWYARQRLWNGEPPKRWDIVVFKSAEDAAEHDTLVKRIVGLPGEHVSIHDGQVHINGQPLELPPDMPPVRYTSPPPAFTDMRYGLLGAGEFSVVPQGHVFVLGDNSPYSRDGRVFGWLPNENILGRVSCVWWPTAHGTDFTGFTRSWFWRGVAGLLLTVFLLRMFVGRTARFPDPGSRRDERIWAFVSYVSFGLRMPFSTRWLFRVRRPRRDQWIAIEDYPQFGVTSLTLARVLGVPGDRIVLGDTVSINGVPTGVAGPGSESDSTAAVIPNGEYLVVIHDDHFGLRLHRTGKHSIRGTVHPMAPGRRLSAAASV